MKKHLQRVLCLFFYVALVSLRASTTCFAQAIGANEEQRVKDVIVQFYEGWNTHDVEKMVSVYADDIDHVNAFGEWHKGKQVMRDELTKFHADRTRNTYKTITVEKVRFIKPDVAVAIVRQVSTVGNVGTFVLSKDSDKWLIVSFANVPYKLPEK